MSMNNADNIRRHEIVFDESKTIQSAEPDCNINNILEKYKRTGQLAHISNTLGMYSDISEIPTLHECMNIVADAQSVFAELPASVRKQCAHDPSNFEAWLSDPRNREEADQLGLFEPVEEPAQIVPSPQETETNTVPTPAPPKEPEGPGGGMSG